MMLSGPSEFVIGLGIDVVDIEGFSRLLSKPMDAYLKRYFTNDELVATGEGTNQIQRLAVRFAVKEAVMKALGTGWGNGIAYTDVEVLTLEKGTPPILLRRKLAFLEKERAIVGWHVSTSNTNMVAIASVIAISEV